MSHAPQDGTSAQDAFLVLGVWADWRRDWSLNHFDGAKTVQTAISTPTRLLTSPMFDGLHAYGVHPVGDPRAVEGFVVGHEVGVHLA